MSAAEVLDIARDGIWTLIIVASPPMLVALIVGVVVATFQSMARLQEMTLVFVPKILAVFFAMLVALPFMAQSLEGYMERIAKQIASG
jgi:flagellar biosynthetic protein FliQ